MAKNLLYLMENLVKTDTQNKNIVFFCNYLKENKVGVRFLTTKNNQNTNISHFGDNIEVIKLSNSPEIKMKFLLFPIGYLIKNKEKYDSIWCYLGRPSSFYAAAMKIFFGKKLIVKCDSMVSVKSRNPITALWRYLTINLPLKKADFVIAESDRVKNAVLKLNKKVEIIPNGIFLKNYEKMDKKLRNVKKENIVLSVGRVEPIKGTDILIKAFYNFWKRNKNWKLRIVGPTDNTEYINELKDLITKLFPKNKSKNLVEITGTKFGEDLFKEMKKAKIYCNAARPLGEGFSNTLPQAMFFGCHAVITDVGDMAYQLKGLPIKLAKPEDIKSLSELLEFASKNRLLEKTLKNHIKSSFTWEKNLSKLNQILPLK